MNIGKIILGIILLALIPTHWFLGSIALNTLTGIPGMLVAAIWLMLLIGGISLIFAGLHEPDVVVETHEFGKYPKKNEFDKHRDVEIKKYE